jgi:hypothetical protein
MDENPLIMIPQEEQLINRFHYGQMSKSELQQLIRMIIKDERVLKAFKDYQMLMDSLSEAKS